MSTNLNNFSNPDQMADLKKALDRALNTWDDGPRWLFDLCDGLAAGTITGVTFYEGETGRGKAVAPLSGNGEAEYNADTFEHTHWPAASVPWPTENKGQQE